jgi:hypothetical protein
MMRSGACRRLYLGPDHFLEIARAMRGTSPYLAVTAPHPCLARIHIRVTSIRRTAIVDLSPHVRCRPADSRIQIGMPQWPGATGLSSPEVKPC